MHFKTLLVTLLSCALLLGALTACDTGGTSSSEPESPEVLQPTDGPEENDRPLDATEGGSAVVDAILASFSASAFTTTPVTDAHLLLILESGAKAPSAMNTQGWHFTVVRDLTKMQAMARYAVEGNVVIIVSVPSDARQGVDYAYDSGLATQNMNIAAQSLGYGARIYASPVGAINQDKTGYGIPEGYEAIAVIQIGSVENYVDAAASASTRNPLDDMVTWLDD